MQSRGCSCPRAGPSGWAANTARAPSAVCAITWVLVPKSRAIGLGCKHGLHFFTSFYNYCHPFTLLFGLFIIRTYVSFFQRNFYFVSVNHIHHFLMKIIYRPRHTQLLPTMTTTPMIYCFSYKRLWLRIITLSSEPIHSAHGCNLRHSGVEAMICNHICQALLHNLRNFKNIQMPVTSVLQTRHALDCLLFRESKSLA